MPTFDQRSFASWGVLTHTNSWYRLYDEGGDEVRVIVHDEVTESSQRHLHDNLFSK